MTESPHQGNLPSDKKRALLIGVRAYPFIPGEYGQPLAGCHNDVHHMREALLVRGFGESEIQVLVDRLEGCDCPFCCEGPEFEGALPTRRGILEAVQGLSEATQKGDIVVIYYSGHGSEFSGRGLAVGQRFQTIVPHDSGRGKEKNRDIADREIEGWIRDFSDKTPYLTLIFDCCHSGGLADLRSEAVIDRKILADERTEPEAFSSGLRQALREERAGTRNSSGWLRGAGRSAVVLSASAAKELSSETVAGGKKQGLFTHNLTKALSQEKTTNLRWAELFPQVAEAVTRENLAQHPRREGDAPVFAAGEVVPDDVYPPDVIELKKLAVVVGIDYNGPQEKEEGKAGVAFPPLRAPRNDALEVARVLEEVQGYEIVGLSSKRPGPLLNEKATRARIHRLLNRLVTVRARTQRECAVVIYFAGHGVVRHEEDGRSAGYLVPWDADRDDPSTWLPMKDLRDQLVEGIRDPDRLAGLGHSKPLARLTSRHLLLVLDCCFGGALAFDFFRGSNTPDRPIYYSEYKRFVEGTAWQLLNSASSNQQAMDRDPKDPDDPHSPFARALIEGLSTDRADVHRQGSRSDQIITATELHQFIDRRLKQQGVDIQTPGLMPLRPIQGQFIFHVPGFKPTPLPDPVLRRESNPWRGGTAYGGWPGSGGEKMQESFHGREMATFRLLESFLALPSPTPPARHWPSLAVAGPSGSGTTSLVRAGLLPLLTDPAPGRQRMRSLLTRRALKHYLVSREDLQAVRKWSQNLELDAWLDQPKTLANKVRQWAVGESLLDSREETAARMQERIQMEHYGVPSFAPEARDEEAQEWVRRLALIKLLETPETLADRLGLWLTKSAVMDYLTVSDRALVGLVGRWRVVPGSLAQAEAEKRTENLLVLVDAEEPESAETWRQVWHGLAAGPPTRTIACLRADALERNPEVRQALAATDVEGRPLWHQMSVPRVSRDELREIVTGPAAAKVLLFEPPELIDRLLAEVEHAPVSLPWLSMTLSRMYERAWDRRRDADRRLLAEDLGPGGATAFLCGQAEVSWCRLVEEDMEMQPILERLFLRLVAQDSEQLSGRPVIWRELELVHPAARQRLEGTLLPALIKDRILVAARDHVELASHRLIDHWPRLHNLVLRQGTSQIAPQVIWRRALEWESSGFDRGKLWARDRNVRTVLRSTHLNQLEWAFIVASEMVRRATILQSLATLAMQFMHRDWQRCAVLIGAAADFAVRTQKLAGRLMEEPLLAYGVPWSKALEILRGSRDLSVGMAEQALRDVLAETPLSLPLPLPVPGKITGLCFDGKETLQVRIGEEVWAYNLRDLEHGPRRQPESAAPRDGDGQATARWTPLLHDVTFPTISAGVFAPLKAQASYDGAIRFLAPRNRWPWGPRKAEATALLGHRGVPVFLAFSPSRLAFLELLSDSPVSRRWLASAANSATGGELRCWPIDKSWGLPSEPLPFLGKRLVEVFPDQTTAGAQRVSGSDRLPAALVSGAISWQIEKLSTDGSFFVVRDLNKDQCQTFKLPMRASRDLERKAVGGPHPPSLPWLGPPPALAELGAPPVPPGFLPPWLRGAKEGIREILLSPDGRWLAASSEAGTAGLWSLPDLRLVWSAGAVQDPPSESFGPIGVTSMAFNPAVTAEVVLAVGTEEGSPWFIVPGGLPTAPETGPGGRISTMVWSPDGQRLAIGALDGTVCLWTARPGISANGVRPVVLKCRPGFAVRGLAFDGQGKRLAVERRAVYEPYERRVDVHRMDLEELIRYARGHTGRDLEPHDLPLELWGQLVDSSEEEKEESRKEEEENRERKLYLKALGLLD